MNARTLAAIAATALVVIITGCGPDDTDASSTNSTATTPGSSSQEDNTTATEDAPQDSNEVEADNSVDPEAVSRSYPEDFICSQVTAADVMDELGLSVTPTSYPQAKGTALCVYAGKSKGFTIGYMNGAYWPRHVANIGKGPTPYKRIDDNTLVTSNKNEGGCAVRDDNGMLIFVQGLALTDEDKLAKFCGGLRTKIQ